MQAYSSLPLFDVVGGDLTNEILLAEGTPCPIRLSLSGYQRNFFQLNIQHLHNHH